ncbi:hypothetical protein [Actinoallomurus iriomotensis]|nr:hypothetical protein [Actinoallomurus iriomotensis]
MKRLLQVTVALVVVAGCGNGGQLPASAPVAPSESSAVAMPAFLRVSGRPTSSMMAVVWRNGVATITSRLGGRKVTIAGKAGRYTRNGRLLAVVRNYRDGVRLKNATGATLWRARISRTQVQILRGETEIRYVFRPYGDDRILVRQGTLLVGSVRAVENGAELVNAGGVRLGTSSSRPGNDMAVLLCAEIPPDLRAILTAVLIRRR